MDDAIQHWFRNEHKLEIGARTAEQIKISVGSAMRTRSRNILVKKFSYLYLMILTTCSMNKFLLELTRLTTKCGGFIVLQIAKVLTGMSYTTTSKKLGILAPWQELRGWTLGYVSTH